MARQDSVSPQIVGSSLSPPGPTVYARGLDSWNRWITSPTVALTATTALAAVLRLLFLSKSFWEAEGDSVGIVRGNQAAGSWSAFGSVLWGHEFNMAFYYVLLRLWLHLGDSEFVIRLLSFIPGVAAVPLIYVLGKRLYGQKVALMAALLLAIHGAHLAYSQEARSYALLVFLCTSSYLAFVRAIETSATKYWLLYTMLSALAIYTHFFALLVPPAQVASLLWLPRGGVAWRRLIASAGGIFLLTIPVFVFILTKNHGQLSSIHSTWGRVPILIGTFAGNGAAIPVYFILWGWAIYKWTSSGLFSIRSKEAWYRVLAVNWLAVPTILTLLACLITPVLEPRYLLLCVPAGVLVAACGLLELPEARRQQAAFVAVMLSMVGVVYTYVKPKENWRAAAGYVLSQARTGDVVTVIPPSSRWPFDYYLNRQTAPGLTYSFPETTKVDAWASEVMRHHSRVWVVYDEKAGVHNAPVANMHIALSTALAQRYQLQERLPLNMGWVELYTETADH